MEAELNFSEALSRGRARLDPRPGFVRVAQTLPAAIQIVAAALIAYSIARFGLDHPAPVIAVTIVISSLGFVRDARPIRVVETVIGMTVGIIVSEALLLGIGYGVPQLGLILLTTIAVSRFLSPAASFAVAATLQSGFVAVLPPPPGGVFTRTLDAVVGGIVAILATALIPRDPRRATRRDAMRVFSEFTGILTLLVSILRAPDATDSSRALTWARSVDPLVAAWRNSLDSAIAIARISPFLHRHLPGLRRQLAILAGVELATRNLRMISRRVDYVVRDDKPRPKIADTVGALIEGVELLRQSIDNASKTEPARECFTRIARHLTPPDTMPEELAEASLTLQIRPFVVDLLCATGMPFAEAQATPPPFD